MREDSKRLYNESLIALSRHAREAHAAGMSTRAFARSAKLSPTRAHRLLNG